MDWEKIMQQVQEHGPRRVVVDEHCHAVNPYSARREYEISWEIVLIREDGWTLGAPMHLSHLAFALWTNKWRSYMVDGDDRIFAIDTWSDRERHFEMAQERKWQQ